MTQEYAPTAHPSREAVVHRPEVDYLTPDERAIYEDLRNKAEIRRQSELMERREYLTNLGAEAVVSVIANDEAEKQRMVAENYLNSVENQLERYSPLERQAIIDDIMNRLVQVGHERIDQGLLSVLAVKTARIQALEDHKEQLKARTEAADEALDGLVAVYQGDPEVLEEIEQAVKIVEQVEVTELPDYVSAEAVSTAEMELVRQLQADRAKAESTPEVTPTAKPRLLRELAERALANLRPSLRFRIGA